MEKPTQSNEDKDTKTREAQRKLKMTDEQWPVLKRSKWDEKSDTTQGTRRVIQPTYEVAGQTQEECLEEYPVFIKWIEENLPSQHLKSKGVHRISIARSNENGSYKTKSMSNIRAVQFDFKGTKTVNSQSLQKLAEKHALRNGKWMFYGKTGNDIDQLWRSVTNGVIQGTIPTFCAKVSAARIENDNHMKEGMFQSLFDLSYDKDASKSAVAGIVVKMKSSTLLSISGPSKTCQHPITLGIKSISPIIRYRGRWNNDVRVSVLFHDGNTCMRGVAFGAAALKFKRKLKVGRTYKFRYYKIGVHDKRYSNTKYRIHLRENTTTKKIENGYAYIPKEKGLKIAEMKEQIRNLLVSTLKVKIRKVGDLTKPTERFYRNVYVSDETGKIRIEFWSNYEK
ncbi:unnamed protein product [Mytilus edulis]|uniref:Uncharacterized protein n=1 Tax=Mytilus edulis TaxID=6550 RepID=A0A8S3TUD2_MYTED|nr:unnamed protein product [Mytilus edulis]